MTEPRITPYALIFGAPSFDESHFTLIREQAEGRPATSPTELLMLPATGTLLRELLPEDGAAGQHRELVARLGALLFHAFRFWLHDQTVYEFTEPAARALVERSEPIGEWRLEAPAPAGYVQLPRNLFWARVAEDVAPEPADGFFWSAPTADEGVRGARVDVLLVLGVRRGRPGVSLVDVSMESGDELQHWGDVTGRPDGADFANVLPGGELQGYHALITRAEVLKLASRCLWRIDTGVAGAVEAEPGTRRFRVDG
jgi:hypothetical protein